MSQIDSQSRKGAKTVYWPRNWAEIGSKDKRSEPTVTRKNILKHRGSNKLFYLSNMHFKIVVVRTVITFRTATHFLVSLRAHFLVSLRKKLKNCPIERKFFFLFDPE